jgi:predicted transcriptional regulator
MTKRPSLASNMKALAEPTAPDPEALVAKAREERPPFIERKTFHAATREGMKRLLTPVEPELHKRLKLLAVQQETTLEAITRAALMEYISKHG